MDRQTLSYYVSLAGTVVGILLGATPIFPFLKIVQGKENCMIFPESMIFFNIFCPMLWVTYWLRQDYFVPYFSAAVGLIQGTFFCTVYLYFYFRKSVCKWFFGICIQYGLTYGIYYSLMFIVPHHDYIGKVAAFIGIVNSIAPAQNVIKVCRERSYKLIPIASTLAGFLCSFLWFLFGVLIYDINNIVVNAVCSIISFTTCFIYFYFYCTANEKDEEKKEELTD